jgi:hypothetical protein
MKFNLIIIIFFIVYIFFGKEVYGNNFEILGSRNYYYEIE